MSTAQCCAQRGSVRWLTRAAMLVGALISATLISCSLHPMPMDSPAPRELALPFLGQRCLKRRASAPELELVSPGAPPHTRLRLVPRGGLEADIRLLGAPDFERGPYSLSTEWIDTGRRGQSCHRFSLRGGLDPEDDPDDPIVGVLVVNANGAISLATDGLDPTSQRVEQELGEMLAAVDPLLPSEPVGVGAHWRHRDEGWRGGELVEVVADYQLVALQGTQLVLEVVQHWHRPAGSGYDARGRRVQVQEKRWLRTAVLDLDLRMRPFPSARFFDEQGRETARISVAYR